MKKIISMFLCIFILTQTIGCGYFLHPERREQRRHSGQLDTTIVVLDAVGLLFFLIPGIIAFAVDYSSKTIYLPAGYRGDNGGVIYLGQDMSDEAIEATIYKETGIKFGMNDSNVKKFY
ncbi:hypothetical protein ACFL0U_02120 [Pseudomonadota bacterium]